jgi:hypothetical protein
MSSTPVDSEMPNVSDEGWDLVFTPIKPSGGNSSSSPLAPPGAPERPPSALCESKRLKTGKHSPVLDLSDKMEDAAPKVPTISAKLQLDCAVPVGESFTVKALLTATPPLPAAPETGAEVKYQDVVFCNDASDSARANGCMEGAKEVLASFVNSEPPPGVVRRVRMLCFGTHIEDHHVGPLQLTEINADTRPLLLREIQSMRAYMGGTNIGDPVLFAIRAIKLSRQCDAANGIKSPEMAHVITLTDGMCHSCKYANPDVLTREVRETGAPEKGIQTHYIGFGDDIHGDYMKKASDSGKLGVFHAASGVSGKSGLSTAFEVVLGFLGCDHTFTFEATTFPYGKEEKTVHTLGALRAERTHLIDVDVRRNASGEFPVLALQMLQGGKPIGERVVASLVFVNGHPPQHENAEVVKAMEKLKVQEQVQQVLQSSSTNEEASQQLRYIAAGGGLSAEMQEEVEEVAGACYRSASAPKVFGAQMASQQAHGYGAPDEEEEDDGEDHVPEWNPANARAAALQVEAAAAPADDDEDEIDDCDDAPVFRNLAGVPGPLGSTKYRSLHTVTPCGPTGDEEEEEVEGVAGACYRSLATPVA